MGRWRGWKGGREDEGEEDGKWIGGGEREGKVDGGMNNLEGRKRERKE
jgi:hypothetical protein